MLNVNSGLDKKLRRETVTRWLYGWCVVVLQLYILIVIGFYTCLCSRLIDLFYIINRFGTIFITVKVPLPHTDRYIVYIMLYNNGYGIIKRFKTFGLTWVLSLSIVIDSLFLSARSWWPSICYYTRRNLWRILRGTDRI